MTALSETTICAQLIEKLSSREAVIGVIGMGYVGQPLALRYAQLGYKVLGLDIDQDKVDLLNSGKSDIEHCSRQQSRSGKHRRFEPRGRGRRADHVRTHAVEQIPRT